MQAIEYQGIYELVVGSSMTLEDTANRLPDGQISFAPEGSQAIYAELREIHKNIFESSEVLWNWPSAATLTRPSLSRILYLANIYEQIVRVPGVICEFGAHWGTTSSLLTNLRAHFEPHNYSRTLFIFDTFEGFAGVSEVDGKTVSEGSFSLPPDHQERLERTLSLLEAVSPNAHIRKHKFYVGDACQTVNQFLKEHPEVIVSLAIFDMDVYKATREALAAILPRLTQGSMLVFDELNHPEFPGETVALSEVLGIDGLGLRRDPAMPNCAWATWQRAAG